MNKLLTAVQWFFVISAILIIAGGLASLGVVCAMVEEADTCKERCHSGYKYLECESGVVQMMSGDGEQVYLVKCQDANKN
jgi:hypothetical protein